MEGKSGHIWTAWFGEQESPTLIIAAHDKHFNVIRLSHEPKWPVNVEVNTLMGKTYYANPEFLTYKFEADFIREKDELTRDSWDHIQQELFEALGLYLPEPEPEEEPEPAETPTQLLAEVKIDPNELEAVTAKIHDLEVRLARQKELNDCLEVENVAMRTARDMYREEYHKIMEYFFEGTHPEVKA